MRRRGRSCSNWYAKPPRRAAGSTRPASCWPDPTATYRYGGRGGTDGQQHAPGKGFDQRGSSGRTWALRKRIPRPAACIGNDLRADPRGSAFHQFIHSDGAMSGRRFRCWFGQPVGRDVFHFLRDGYVHARIRRLLQRLADNVSFAIGNFDRADDKARAESQKERLTRMFASLSATNEAIMRAKSRAELFELVCEAAANGGRFTSATIALADPGSDLLRIVAAPARLPRRRGM